MTLELTFKSGAKVLVDVETWEGYRVGNDLTRITWTNLESLHKGARSLKFIDTSELVSLVEVE